MSRVLVTGGGGQLAAEFARVFGAEVWAPGRDQLDVTDEASVAAAIARRSPTLVVHCAAYTDVDGAEADRDGAFRVNEHGSRLVARAAAACHASLVAYSTDYVFSGERAEGYVESDPVGPRSVYGASKLAGEEAVREEHPTAYLVRTAWVFSPRGRNFFRTMLRLGAERDVLTVVDDQIGCPTYTAHLAEGTADLIDRCPPGTYHLAGSGQCSWFDFASAIMSRGGLPARVEPMASSELGRPAPRPACSVLRSEHDCTPRLPDWRQGLDDCLSAHAEETE